MMQFEAFKDLLDARRSMRSFSQEAVSQEILEDVLSAAQYAPSNCNTQPWQLCIVGGEKAEELKQALRQTLGQGEFNLDFPYDDTLYEGVYKDRQRGAGKAYYAAAGIERNDKKSRGEFLLNNIDFWGAPHAAFLFVQNWCGPREICDAGMYAQNVMLALRSHNIGSCPQTLLGFNAETVREVLGLPDSLRLLFGISFGYFDPENPLNQVRTERASLDDAVTFYR